MEEGTEPASAIRMLSDAHAKGRADVAIIAIMASERQRDRSYIETFEQFEDRRKRLGIDHLRLCLPLAYYDICFFDKAVWASEESLKLERRIHDILFPKIQFGIEDYSQALGLVGDGLAGTELAKWRNAKCDVLTMWGHLHNGRDVFVTSDKNFHSAKRKSALLSMGAGKIEFPNDAAAMLGE